MTILYEHDFEKIFSVKTNKNVEVPRRWEYQVFKDIENEMLHSIFDAHDFKNLSHMRKGEVLRLVAHVENMQPENYTEITWLNSKLFVVIQTSLVAKLNEIASQMSLPEHYVDLSRL